MRLDNINLINAVITSMITFCLTQISNTKLKNVTNRKKKQTENRIILKFTNVDMQVSLLPSKSVSQHRNRTTVND